MRLNHILVTSLLIVSSLGQLGCQAVQDALGASSKPTARVVDAELTDLTLDDATIGFDVEVSNPYAAALPLVNVGYDLSSSNTSFLRGTMRPTGSIPAKGKKVLRIPAQVTFQDALNVLQGVAPGSVVPYRADVTLEVDAPVVGPLQLPLAHNGEVPIPAIPEVSVAGIEWEELGITRAAGAVAIDVGNTNQFDATIAAFDYALNLGDTTVASGKNTNATPIPPGQTRTITIPIELGPLDMGLGLLRMLMGNDTGYSIEGALTLDTPFGGVTLPYQQSGRTNMTR